VADDHARRRALLTTALVMTQLADTADTVPGGRMLRAWLDTWQGIGHVAVGMDRQGFDLQLTKYADRGWRATFYTSGMEHAPTSSTGSAWERTRWRAVQRAALDALKRADLDQGPTPNPSPQKG
jgi:hypothetical protein